MTLKPRIPGLGGQGFIQFPICGLDAGIRRHAQHKPEVNRLPPLSQERFVTMATARRQHPPARPPCARTAELS
ncbi:uncharacterized [Tachysurus ichikawai]